MTLQDGFEIAVFVGWAGCICCFISIARHSSSEFQRRKITTTMVLD